VIAVNTPHIGEEEEALVLEVLRSGQLVKGPMLERFEAAVGRVAGTTHAVAVNSGTSALVAALMAHGVGPGDEVVTSPFTFVATLNAILLVGARPRFVDIGDDFDLDPDQLATALGPDTRAIMPVHLYGLPADVPRMVAACEGRDVAVVEDAAQALGASVDGTPAGGFGTGCFSFYATKNVTTAEGGVVTTDDDLIADAVRLLRDQGQRSTYEYARPGFNFRMTELQAALGVAQLARLDGINDARRRNAEMLTSGLDDIEGLILPRTPAGRTHVFHQYTVRVTERASLHRDELQRCLSALGIATGVYYPRPVFEYECFRSDPRVGSPETPRTARMAREVLSLPVHPRLEVSDIEHIVDAVHECLA
jgi:dTDP-4-amino-4,6-dideoxygalactose transaminase